MRDIASGSHYVAMGSSFGAGPGLKPRAGGSPREAGRSDRNYAHLLAASRSFDLSDVTFSGATTSDLLGPSADGTPAQLDAVRPETRLVTITAGGNDVGYLPAITLSSFPRPLRLLASIQKRISDATDSDRSSRRLGELVVSLSSVVERIHDRAPHARIVIVDYLTILPSDLSLIGSVPSPHVAAWALDTAARLTAAFTTVAEQAGCELLPVGRESQTHHAWSREPWTRRFHYSLRNGAPYHPTASGMRAVFGMLDAALTA